ncbi:hypothetical protein A3B97_02820 [Candidatus Giovannonibacteria bacterium RIFCSPHIGHO2_02_FULL_43_32]|nr:MAG: hypothetical protein A3B97_02820 [Candidatus Giovannonibacteria bacterium RIFCSPHIGHO2_02_FULL_43_32]
MVGAKKKDGKRRKNSESEVSAEIQFIGGSMIVRPLMISLSEEQFHGIRRDAIVRGIKDCRVVKTFHGLAFSIPIATATAANTEILTSLFGVRLRPQLATAK